MTGRPFGARGLLGAVVIGFALLLALPAWSASLIQVRVGNHPTYTRVVFEFDGPTGYRVERRSDGDPTGTIVVTLDAQSNERNIVSKSKGVETVRVAAGTNQAVAEIHTRTPGMPIREMILADPPRVVLDLLLPESAKVAAKAPVVRERPAPDTLAAEVPAQPEAVLEVAEAALVAPAPSAVEVQAVEEAAAETPLAEAAAGESVVDVANADEAIEVPVLDEQATAPMEPGRDALADAADTAAEIETDPVDLVDELENAQARAEQAAVPQRGESPAALPVEATEPTSDLAGGLDMKLAAMIAAGVLAIGLVALLIMRSRRGKPDSMDVTSLVDEDDAEADEAGWSIPEEQATAASTFETSSAAPDMSLPEEDFELIAIATEDDENKPIEAAVAATDTAPGLFDETPEEEVATMLDDQDLPTRMDSEAPTQLGFGAAAAGVGDSDVSNLLKEFERRMAHMEARLDEANEARERLERQVEAQNEELRVQRAAIARTQRALRSLNRSEEDQATEPALRDPSTPTS